MRVVVCCLLAFGLSITAQAKVYKFVDENGRVTYSDRRPVKVPTGRVEDLSDDFTEATTSDKAENPPQPLAAAAPTPGGPPQGPDLLKLLDEKALMDLLPKVPQKVTP